MWITTITYDLVAIRQLSESDFASFMGPIQNKKNELRDADGHGLCTTEYPAPTDYNDIPIDQTTWTVQRAWIQQTNAQAFVDYFAGVNHIITATLEEQV